MSTAETTDTAFSAIISADRLDSFLDKPAALVAECKAHLNDDGLQIRAVDPANVAMVDAELSEDGFESCDGDGELIGLELERLQNVVGMADKGELVSLDVIPETRKLQVAVGNLEATIALIDPDSIRQEPDIPELDLVGEFTLEGREINRAVKATDLVADHIAIGFDVDAGELRFEGEGDTDDVSIGLERGDLIDGHCAEDCRSLFSLDYLKDINKEIGANDEITLRIGDELPTKFDFGFAEGAGAVTYMLAPRVQD